MFHKFYSETMIVSVRKTRKVFVRRVMETMRLRRCEFIGCVSVNILLLRGEFIVICKERVARVWINE